MIVGLRFYYLFKGELIKANIDGRKKKLIFNFFKVYELKDDDFPEQITLKFNNSDNIVSFKCITHKGVVISYPE